MPFSIATFNTRDFFDDEPPHLIGELDREGVDPKHSARASRLFKEKVAHIGGVLSELDADIVCLQEIKGEKVLRALAEYTETRGPAYPVRVAGSDVDPRGIRVGLLARFEQVSPARLHSPADYPGGFALPALAEGAPPPGGLQFRRGILEASLRSPLGLSITVLVVHFKSPNPWCLTPPMTQADLAEGYVRSSAQRMAEALQVRRVVDAHLGDDPRKLLVVAGDINESEDSLVHRVLCGVGPEEDRYALRTPALVPVSSRVPAEHRYSICHRGKRYLFDHILTSPELHQRLETVSIRNADLAQTSRILGTSPRPRVESDHAPVLAVFR